MPNGNTHCLIAALAVGGVHFTNEVCQEEATEKPLISATVASMLATVPDILEPATNPHHRQFFHSILFGGAVVYAGAKVYEWQPEDEFDKVLRSFLLIGCGTYLVHLLADSFTPRSLPLLGRLQ